MISWLLVLLSVLMIAACGTFVAAEFSFLTVDRAAVEGRAAAGDRASAGVLTALRHLSTQLSGAQVGITVTNLLIGFLAEPAVADLIEGPLTSAGVPDDAVPGISVALALVLATGATMIFGELVPKNLAIARPLATARAVQGMSRAVVTVAGPVIAALNGTANRIVRSFGVEPSEELASARSPQELVSLVRRSAQQGTLPEETAALFVRSALFGEKTAADVLTPRPTMVTVAADAPVSAVVEAATSTGMSRFPVLGDGGLDDVVGVVHAKHVPRVPRPERDSTRVREIMAPALFVPESLSLDPLLDRLREQGLQLAVVVDEYGGTAGVVTLEDLVEELVGEVTDEHDLPGEPTVRPLGDGDWDVSGLLRPDEVGELTGLRLPEDDTYETLAGLISHRLDRIPGQGDTVVIEGVRATVERMDGRRVDRVRLHPVGPVEAGADRG